MTKRKKDFWERQGDQPIRFRIWDKAIKSFVCGPGQLKTQDDGSMEMEIVGMTSKNVIQQCTWCRDRHDNLIFEGDILETNESGWRGVVIYCDGQFALEDTTGGFSRWPDWEECKVIGNVYQNPELIP